ncbi:MAG: aspartate--tRNA ligase [Fusobacteria bacterium]|nr:aspartate--tRNA ligase [Fusobacteriota bacterium]
MYRSHNLGELRASHIGDQVVLSGWVHQNRDLGNLIFINLRDRYGITQVVVQNSDELIEKAKRIGLEDVICIEGKVIERSSKNSKLETGDIEVEVVKLTVLSKSKPSPIDIHDKGIQSGEELRLKYRYLDLRGERMKRNMISRNTMITAMREFLSKEDFLDIDTPILSKATPEGARDFVVPSRLAKHEFFALPQSPQLFKQILMISGLDKYFQIAKCFRDEDLRADRQLEFTQLDIEMSFITSDEFMTTMEKLAKYIHNRVLGEKIAYSFPRISYHEAIENYGIDKPDTRFDMKIQNITNVLANSSFSGFSSVVSEGKTIRAIVAKNLGEKISRKIVMDFEEVLKKQFKIKGLVFIKFGVEITSPIKKFLSDEEVDNLKAKLCLENNDMVFIVADSFKIACESLGKLRIELGHMFKLANENQFNYLWVTKFPLLEWSEEDQRYKAQHHPFTAILADDFEMLATHKEVARTDSYDLVLNGNEIGGGSIRIHNRDVQNQVFEMLGLSPEEIKHKFGFFLEAFQYGVPPHGGMAYGLDRYLMVLLKESSIREVIPFPKTNKGRCLMMESPCSVDTEQLEELAIELKNI